MSPARTSSRNSRLNSIARRLVRGYLTSGVPATVSSRPRPAILRRCSTSMDSHRPGVTSFVHVGSGAEDLDERVRFLSLLGFDCGEPGVFGGEWIGRIIGLENVTVETVMAPPPHGRDMFAVG